MTLVYILQTRKSNILNLQEHQGTASYEMETSVVMPHCPTALPENRYVARDSPVGVKLRRVYSLHYQSRGGSTGDCWFEWSLPPFVLRSCSSSDTFMPIYHDNY